MMTEPGLMGKILSLFFPSRCLLCGELTKGGGYICENCSIDEAEKRSRTFNIKAGKRSEFFVVSTPFEYEGAYRDAIIKLKFRGFRSYADSLAAFIFDSFGADSFADFDFICAVPMTDKKRRKRGYNQAELIAKRLSKLSGTEYRKALTKIKENKTQHTLSKRERSDNVRGVYALSLGVKGQNILIIDDIITTGATISECALQLYRGGAAAVSGICAANASEPGSVKSGAANI